MQEQLVNQLTRTLEERAGLDAEKASQVTQVVLDFVREHLPELMQAIGGGEQSDLLGGMGKKLFGG